LPIRSFARCLCRLLLLLVLIGAAAPLLFPLDTNAQQPSDATYSGLSVEASPQIFATMAALDASGFDADENALGQMPASLALRDDLLKLHGPATQAIRQFYKDHALADSAETLSPYITFALIAGPPPTFELPARADTLPPDLLSIDGFQPLLEAFYQEAQLDARWRTIEPEYQPSVVRYESLLGRIVLLTNSYLREIVKAQNGRGFTIYVEPLVGSRINFRNYGDHYSIVVGPISDALTNTIQHGYLHFVLDPIVLRNRAVIEKKRPLLQIAVTAPRLPLEYRDDYVSFVDECFIRAVELRLRHLSSADLESALRDADSSGFIMVRPFVTQLKLFEKAEPAMSYFFPDIMAGIDVAAEQQRLKGFAFAAGDPEPEEQGAPVKHQQVSEIDLLIDQGNREIAQKNPAAAEDTFAKALEKYPDAPRALYGLAVASVLSGDAARARELFEKVVSIADSAESPSAQSSASQTKDASAQQATTVDPEVLGWCHVYLGRIHDLEDERQEALTDYRAALGVSGAPESVRVAAQNGLDAAYQPPQRPPQRPPEQPPQGPPQGPNGDAPPQPQPQP
jgi:tetratricopeptide (TPR) repeat protein